MFTVPSNSCSGSAIFSRAVPCAVKAPAWNVVLSAMRSSLSLLLHDDDAVGRTGDGAADVDQVAIHVDLLDTEMGLRVTRRTVVAGHLLALDDSRRIGAGSDRPGTTVLRVAVRVRTAANAVALDDALKAAALRRAGDFHRVTNREDIDLDRVADAVRRDLGLGVARLIETDAAQNTRHHLETSLLRVADGRQRGA